MMTPEEVIAYNFKGREGSFIHDLHEKNYFNPSSFKVYVQAIIELTPAATDTALDRTLMDQVFFTYSYILKSIMWHFDMNDQSVIENLPEEQLVEYVDRLEKVVRQFIRGGDAL
ncbi:Imm41 family immunity protein [Paenibacillus shenyangensis]|uniref:Imm41 family immunity protein n=1 Tax=Paenibacillus sp. A9 TaxID=1284352 RepID=UPI000369BE8B|nr:Imm41 family immunity protein [Paenibacillus sp. A9]